MTSTVIKAGSGDVALSRLSTVDLADHLAEARAVVAAAKRRADAVVAAAHTNADEVLDEARRRGHESGYAEGMEKGTKDGHKAAFDAATKKFDAQHADLVADLGHAIGEIDRIKDDLRIAAERDVLDFAVTLATKITFTVGRLNREAAQENFRRALRRVANKTDLSVRVHPSDLESMKTFAPSVLKRAGDSPALCVEADDSLTPGGCVVRTGRTEVDASLDTQIDEMVSLLLGKRKDDG